MKYKKSFLFVLLIMALFSIASVCAVDMDENMTSACTDDIIVKSTDIQVIEQTDNNDVMELVDNGTFTALQNKINNAKSGSTITLENDYIFNSSIDSDYKNGIEISRYKHNSLTIDGNGYCIDGNGESKIFTVGANNVILKNIVFKNIYSSSSNTNGAIFAGILTQNCIIENCSFLDMNVKYGNCAIEWHGDGLMVTNCYFANNCAKDGAIVIFFGKNINVNNCTFLNNSGHEAVLEFTIFADLSNLTNCNFTNNNLSKGDVLIWKGNEGIITNCSFENNVASQGCTFLLSGAQGIIDNCSFVNNLANNGGAIYSGGMESLIKNCSFINNVASYGGAISSSGDECNLSNCYFFKNNALNYGGAIYLASNNCFLSKCTFIDNIGDYGGAILIQGNNTVLNHMLFENNSASTWGGTVYWMGSQGLLINGSFRNNSANLGGAVFWRGNDGTISNSNFFDNFAFENASSIYWYGKNGNLTDCIVADNFNLNQVYWWNAEKGSITGCTFINNTHGVINRGANFVKRNVNLTGHDHVFDYGHPENISVELINVLDNIPIDSSIFFIFNHGNDAKNFTAKLSNNIASLLEELSDLTGGKWNVTALFEGDDNYSPCNVSFTLTINPIASSLTIEFSNATVGRESNLKVTVGNDYNFTINEGVVVLYDGGEEIESSSVADNVAIITCAPTSAGEHQFTVMFHAESYKDSVNSTLINVSRTDVILYPLDEPSDDGTIIVFLSSDATGTLTIRVNNKDYSSDVIGGSAFVKLPDLPDGDYNYTITYSGDNKYLGFTKENSFKINKTNSNPIENTTNGNGADVNSTGGNASDKITVEPEITIPPLDEPAADGSVTITLPGDATGNITLLINNEVYSTVAVENGQAKVVIPVLDNGNYQYTIKYSGDNKYSPIINNGSMKINNGNGTSADNNTDVTVIDPEITVSDLTALYIAKNQFNATVYDTDGKLAKNIPVVFKVDGAVFATVNTDSNGVATFEVTQIPGTYTVTAEALGATASAKLTVKHILKLKKVSVKRSAKKLVLTAGLKKVNGKYLNKQKVTFKFNGKKYKVKTDKKGVAKLTIKSNVLKKLQVGKKVTYQATFKKDTVKKSVKVKK